MRQTVMLIAEPEQVNHILIGLADVGIGDVSLEPIYMGVIDGREDVMLTYQHEAESEEELWAHRAWVEDSLGSRCKVY